jgi:RNA polymerase sigma-70 factor, ECF subfamily
MSSNVRAVRASEYWQRKGATPYLGLAILAYVMTRGRPMLPSRQNPGDLMDSEQSPQREASDELLVKQLTQGNVDAFGVLYDRYIAMIYALAVHLLGPADAEEVVQEIFLRLWDKAVQFDPTRGPFRHWFLALARHQVLRELRKRSRQQRLTAVGDIETLLAHTADPSVDLERSVWGQEDAADILRALNSLPDEQRRVLVLAYFGGFSQSAIAEYLGWPLGTVKKRTQLGLQKLRVALQQDGQAREAPTAPGKRSTE